MGCGKPTRSLRSLFFSGAKPPLLRIIINKHRSLRSLAWKWLSFSNGGSEAEGRAAETGETETGEIGCPSVAVLMLPNVNIGFDNTRDWVYN